MPQMPASTPIRVDLPGRAAAEPLAEGLSVGLFAFSPGCVSLAASTRHLVSVHVGPPVRMSCRCDGRAYERLQVEGDIDFVPAGIPGYWEDETPARALVVRMSPAWLRRAAREAGLPARPCFEPRFKLRDPRLEHIAWAMRAELEAGEPGGRTFLESLCAAMACRLVQGYGTPVATGAARAGQLAGRRRRQVLDYIEERLDEALTLDRLAAVAGVSASHFKALFRNAMGQPVHQYVMARRVERARALLERGEMPLAEVALEAGFSHQSHMARWMRRVLGTTPAALRGRR